MYNKIYLHVYYDIDFGCIGQKTNTNDLGISLSFIPGNRKQKENLINQTFFTVLYLKDIKSIK